jgi:hypothetical protein
MGIAQGPAIIIIGLLALLLVAGIQFRNALAVIMWGLSVLTLMFAGLYRFDITLFWLSVVVTVVLVIVGVVGRLMTQ